MNRNSSNRIIHEILGDSIFAGKPIRQLGFSIRRKECFFGFRLLDGRNVSFRQLLADPGGAVRLHIGQDHSDLLSFHTGK